PAAGASTGRRHRFSRYNQYRRKFRIEALRGGRPITLPMPHAAPGPRPTCASRVQRALLLGNAQTLVQLYQATTLADPPLAVTGCVLAGRLPAAPNVLVPLPICGSLDDLERLVREQRPDLVLVSLPLSKR